MISRLIGNKFEATFDDVYAYVFAANYYVLAAKIFAANILWFRR